MEKAVAAMKEAILASTPQWKHSFSTLTACVEYLERQGETDAATVGVL